MPDQHSQSAAPVIDDATPALGETPSRRRRARRTDWRQGGRAVRRWDATVLAVALVCAGAGVIGGALVARIVAPWSPMVSSLVLWAGLLVAVAYAFSRGRPAGLLRFRPVDLLWGVVFGVALRLLYGWLQGVGAGFPTVAAIDGRVPVSWWLTDAVPGALVAPLVEEFFFRAVVLVCVYQLLRRGLGGVAAGMTALLVSAGGFVLMHSVAGALSLSDGAQLFTVGATCALLVLLTGRIWGAVVTHVVYNATYLALALIGTMGA